MSYGHYLNTLKCYLLNNYFIKNDQMSMYLINEKEPIWLFFYVRNVQITGIKKPLNDKWFLKSFLRY